MRKKLRTGRQFILSIALCVVALIAIFAFCANKNIGANAGNESAGSFYEISDATELYQLALDVNNGLYDGYYGVNFKLTKEIDLTDLLKSLNNPLGWTPIGNNTYPFKGTFDGDGNAVTGLNIDSENGERLGLFGVTGVNAIIKNLNIYGFVNGNHYTAGIVGYNQGQIENCKNYAIVTAKTGAMHIGGITGYNAGTINASLNDGEINVGFVTFMGGIAGSNFGSIVNCCNAAALTSTDSLIGGITGFNSLGSRVEDVINGGTISGKSTIGGITGNNQGGVSNAFNSGVINSDNGTAAGIAGSNENTGSISFVLNASKVYGYDYIAAICGYNMGVITRGFYDNTLFSGSCVNGILAEDSKGFPAYILAHSDVLASTEKLKLLTEGNAGAWTKRAYSGLDCCYPELKYFSDNFATVSKNFAIISRVTLTQDDITLSTNSISYNGQEREVDIYLGTVKLEKGQDYTAIYTDNKNSGTANIRIIFINGFSGAAAKTFNIQKSELTTKWNNLEFIYNSNDQAPILNITGGLISGESVTFSYIRLISKNAGTYVVEAVLANTEVNVNYYLPETITQYIIAKADITIKWSDDYFVYNGQVQIPTASVLTGKINVENITFRYEYQENINAKEQTIMVYLADTEVNSNYSFYGETYLYVINKRPLTVRWSDEYELLYYNGLAQFPNATIESGKIGEDDITFIYTGYEGNINANETDGYYVLLSFKDTLTNANYYLEPVNYNYKIYRNSLKIAWWDIPLTYTGAGQYPGFYIVSGLIGEDEIIFDISDYSTNINASLGGAYWIEVMLADNPINANYYFIPLIKIYDIEKASYNPHNNVEFCSQTFAYDGQAKSIYITGALPKGVTVIYQNNGRTDLGDYTITAIFSVDSDNYIPLMIDILTAKIYIARMVFENPKGDIKVENMGNAVYGLELEINTLSDNSQFKEFGKNVLAAYDIKFTDGIAKISVQLKGKQLKRNGIKVLYKNLSGEIKTAEYKIVDGKLIFSAEDMVEFAILSDWNWLLIGMCTGAFAATIMAGILFIIIRKKRLAFANETSTEAAWNKFAGINTVLTAKKASQSEPIQGKPFVLDGIECLSYERFKQSLYFKNVKKQKLVCGGNDDAYKSIKVKQKSSTYWLGKRYKNDKCNELLARAGRATREKE